MKMKLRILAWAGTFILIWVVMGFAGANRSGKEIKEVRVLINDGKENFFLDSEGVKTLMAKRNGRPIEGSAVGAIRIDEIEYALDSNQWVDEAEVFYRNDGSLTAEVKMRTPIVRFLSETGVSFYLDEHFTKFPPSLNYPADVMLLRGDYEEELTPVDTIKDERLRSVLPFIEKVNQDPFFKAFISEIYIDRKGSITLFPEVGDLEIVFGKPERIDEKLDALSRFIASVLNHTGWDRYGKVDLRFEGQVVAQKKFNWL